MGIVTWVIAGAVLGFVSSLIAGAKTPVTNAIVGVVGAGLAGWIATLFGLGTIAAFNIWSLLIAAGGAVVLLLVFILIQRRQAA